MTSDGSTLLSDIADEANALLGSTPLHRGDVRWLTGRLVHVLISPVEPSSDDMAVSLTLAPTDDRPGGLAGLAVDVTDAGGKTRRARLDDDGHALLLLTTDSYRLAVEAPVEATRAAPSLIDLSDPLPLPARAAVGAGRRRRNRPAGRRPTPVRAAALWALPAAVVLLFAAVLVAVRDTPAWAVEVRELTAQCAPPRGPDEDPHVEVAATWGGQEQERFREVLERFSKETGIRVTLSNDQPVEDEDEKEKSAPADRDLKKTLQARIEQDCSPGVALLPQTGLLRDLASGEHLVPITGETEELVRANYSSAWTTLGTVDNELYGVWFKASVKSLIWYNTSAFDKAGIAEPPADWTGLKEVAAKLKAAGVTPFAVAGADDDAWTLTDWFENVYLRTAGKDNYDALARGRLHWDDPTVTIALKTLAEVFGHEGWLVGGAEGSLGTTFEDSVKKVFARPKSPEAAMVFEGDFVATVVTTTRSKLERDAKAFPFPSIISPGTPPLLGAVSQTSAGDATGGDVAVLMSKDPEARALLRYLATPEAAEPWIRAGGFVSPNKKAGGYRNLASQAAAESLAQAETLSFDLSDQLPPAFGGTPRQGMWRILQEFLSHPEDVNGTVDKLQAAYDAAPK